MKRPYSEIQQFIEKPPGKLRIIEFIRRNAAQHGASGAVSRRCGDYKTGRLCGR